MLRLFLWHPNAYPDLVSQPVSEPASEPVSEPENSSDLLDRIESFVPRTDFTISPLATGSLAELLNWWGQRGSNFQPVSIDINIDTVPNFEMGVHRVDAAVDSGATLIHFTSDIDVDPILTRSIIGLLTRKDAWQVTFEGAGAGATDSHVMTQLAETVTMMRAHREKRGNARALADLDPSGVIAFYTGALLAAAARKTPVILGSTQELAAALIAHRISMKASSWWRNGSTSPDRAVGQAIERMSIPAGLPLNLSEDQGIGAQISIELLNTFTGGQDS